MSPQDIDGKQFPTRPAGLDLSGTLSLASVCETHVKCVSVPLNSCKTEANTHWINCFSPMDQRVILSSVSNFRLSWGWGEEHDDTFRRKEWFYLGIDRPLNSNGICRCELDFFHVTSWIILNMPDNWYFYCPIWFLKESNRTIKEKKKQREKYRSLHDRKFEGGHHCVSNRDWHWA